MVTVLNSKQSKIEIATSGKKRGRKRKNSLSLLEGKRSKEEEEKENRRKSASASPKSASPASASPTSTSPISLPAVSEKKPVELVAGRKRTASNRIIKQISISRRKTTAPKHLNILKQQNVYYKSAEELLRTLFSPHETKIKSSNFFLCRNVRDKLKKTKKEFDEYNSPRLNRVLDITTMRRLRTEAFKSSGQRPVFAMEFEKINDWAQSSEFAIVNEYSATSIVEWSIIMVDHEKNITRYNCGFVIVPLFKQVEENMKKEALSKLMSMKLRQFSCPPDDIEKAENVYLVVHAKRKVHNHFITNNASGGRAKRAKHLVVSIPDQIKEKEYVLEERYGCKQLFGRDPRGTQTSFIGNLFHVLLVENGFKRINLKDKNWMLDVDNLEALDLLNRSHSNSYEPRLIISPMDQRILTKSVKKQEKNQLLGMAGKEEKLNMNGLRCPITGVPFKSIPEIHLHLTSRFPCFSFELTKSEESEGKYSIHIEPSEPFFEPKTKNVKFENFFFKKSERFPRDGRYIKFSQPDFSVPTTSNEHRLTWINGIPNMDTSLLPCRTLTYVKKIASKAPANLKNKKKKKTGTSIQIDETFEYSVPHENANLLNEIAMRSFVKFGSRIPLPNEGMRIFNFQLTAKQVKIYKKKQLEAVEEFKKECNRLKRKKKGRGSKKGALFVATSSDNEEEKIKYRSVNLREKLDHEAPNGGLDLDIEGNPIPVNGFILFSGINFYNIYLRNFYADYGHRVGSISSRRMSELLTEFMNMFGEKLVEKNLQIIWQKHLQMVALTFDNFTYEDFIKPYEKLFEMKQKYE